MDVVRCSLFVVRCSVSFGKMVEGSRFNFTQGKWLMVDSKTGF